MSMEKRVKILLILLIFLNGKHQLLTILHEPNTFVQHINIQLMAIYK